MDHCQAAIYFECEINNLRALNYKNARLIAFLHFLIYKLHLGKGTRTYDEETNQFIRVLDKKVV